MICAFNLRLYVKIINIRNWLEQINLILESWYKKLIKNEAVWFHPISYSWQLQISIFQKFQKFWKWYENQNGLISLGNISHPRYKSVPSFRWIHIKSHYISLVTMEALQHVTWFYIPKSTSGISRTSQDLLGKDQLINQFYSFDQWLYLFKITIN